MAKGYIVANIHVRDKEGFEKFREMVLPVGNRQQKLLHELWL